MKELFDSIKNPLWRAFVWRFYNTIKSGVVVVAGAILAYVAGNEMPLSVATFTDAGLWDFAGYTLIVTTMVAISGGIDKVSRK